MIGNKVGFSGMEECECLGEKNGKLEIFKQYFLNNKMRLEFQKSPSHLRSTVPSENW